MTIPCHLLRASATAWVFPILYGVFIHSGRNRININETQVALGEQRQELQRPSNRATNCSSALLQECLSENSRTPLITFIFLYLLIPKFERRRKRTACFCWSVLCAPHTN
ncbi:hypothetical protein BC832DRAFT_545844 [Gaertneriomyces semiglobifer]|nr:hypothetical protein BC832DRAFT_545844 [Gaertneriomyces semiglobifer]